MSYNRNKISKFMAYILRHNPGEFGLEPDEYGYVNIAGLISVIENRFSGFGHSDLNKVVHNAPKNRYKIKGNAIKARYGHSVPVQPELDPVQPPDILYHGTSESAAQKILQNGLKSMNRQFVHLSLNKKDAQQVGSRHSPSPIILKIQAQKAYQNLKREEKLYFWKREIALKRYLIYVFCNFRNPDSM